MREGAIERIKAASRGGKRSTPSNAARIPKLFRKAMSVSLPRKTSSRNMTRPISAIGTGWPTTPAREPASDLRKCSPPLAHLADTASAPPHMSLGVDEDRWAGRVAICNSLSRDAIGVPLGSRKSMCLTLPKREGRGAACKPEQPAAGQCDPRPINNRFGHHPVQPPASVRLAAADQRVNGQRRRFVLVPKLADQ